MALAGLGDIQRVTEYINNIRGQRANPSCYYPSISTALAVVL
jgi:hypothetical protein